MLAGKPSEPNYKFNFDAPQLSSYQQIKEEQKMKMIKERQDQKVVITGDDVLIEYVKRLIKILKDIFSTSLETLNLPQIMECIENFIGHFVWHKEDHKNKR